MSRSLLQSLISSCQYTTSRGYATGMKSYLATQHPHIYTRSRLKPLADRQVTGTISRLAPQQATLLIQISNNKPVPESNEDFTGVIRLADIRLTERDKIKMGDCFRLGDLVRAKVVRFSSFFPPTLLSFPFVLPPSFAYVVIITFPGGLVFWTITKLSRCETRK